MSSLLREFRTCAAPLPVAADTLADSVLILLAMTAVQRLVGFVRAVMFCRWLSPDQLGLWDMAFSFLLVAAPVVDVAPFPGRSAATWSITGSEGSSGRSCGARRWPAADWPPWPAR